MTDHSVLTSSSSLLPTAGRKYPASVLVSGIQDAHLGGRHESAAPLLKPWWIARCDTSFPISCTYTIVPKLASGHEVIAPGCTRVLKQSLRKHTVRVLAL
eukprot:scaffold35419_cov18-Tisochrysis_lutea.AAC.2